jgi:hypothetical protein
MTDFTDNTNACVALGFAVGAVGMLRVPAGAAVGVKS